MIITKYPEAIELQLKLIDKAINTIYGMYIPSERDIKSLAYEDLIKLKKDIYDHTKPLLDEKVRLVETSFPTYIVKKEFY